MLNNYFSFHGTSLSLKQNNKHKTVFFLSSLFQFHSGDILILVYWKEAILYRFEGICIVIRNKSLRNLNTSLIIRNILSGIGIEVTASYYANRAFKLTISDYKRKQFFYRNSKLYYLRKKINRASRVK